MKLKFQEIDEFIEVYNDVNLVLGKIVYYQHNDEFIFCPEGGVVFNQDYLQEIIDYMKNIKK